MTAECREQFAQCFAVLLLNVVLCCAVPCFAGLSKSLKLHKEHGDPADRTPEGSRQGESFSKDDSANPRHKEGTNGSSRKPGPSYKLTGETGSYR